eukprot:GEMP01022816.1.p1 GENE.GEMP01022816.1~~GEMP01022816.1.p1  ORF type:complete len:517 (+),score=107.52 GEMP01022816.1:3-1553(+)
MISADLVASYLTANPRIRVPWAQFGYVPQALIEAAREVDFIVQIIDHELLGHFREAFKATKLHDFLWFARTLVNAGIYEVDNVVAFLGGVLNLFLGISRAQCPWTRPDGPCTCGRERACTCRKERAQVSWKDMVDYFLTAQADNDAYRPPFGQKLIAKQMFELRPEIKRANVTDHFKHHKKGRMYATRWRRLFTSVSRVRYAGRRHVEVVPEAVERVQRLLRAEPGEGIGNIASQTEDICRRLTEEVMDLPVKDSLSALASLSEVSQKFSLSQQGHTTAFTLAFLDVYEESLRRKEPGLESFDEILGLLRSLSALQFDVVERLKGIFRFADQCIIDVPPQRALELLHLALQKGIIPITAMSICEPILERAMQVPSLDDLDLEALKEVEIILRLDYSQLFSNFKKETMEYLLASREAKLSFEPPEDTVVTYQLRYFLQNHEFPAQCHAVGPYILALADPARRICFIHEQEKRRDRHLELLGWRAFLVQEDAWRSLPHREAKARFVRNLLKENNLLDL